MVEENENSLLIDFLCHFRTMKDKQLDGLTDIILN